MVIIILWDTANIKVPLLNDVEDYVLNFFERGGSKMNPSALYGRISAIALDSNVTLRPTDVNFNCQPHEKAIIPNNPSPNVNNGFMDVKVVIQVFIIVGVLVWTICNSGSSTVASSGSGPIPFDSSSDKKKVAASPNSPRR